MPRPLLPALLLLLGACEGARLAPGAHRLSRRQADSGGPEISKPCLECICKARGCDWESGCRNDVCGGFEITKAYFDHTNITAKVPLYRDRTYQSCTTDFKCAIIVVDLYMRLQATDCDEDGTIDCDDMMMTHFYGREGCIGAQSWVGFTDDWKRYRQCISSKAN